ncbi:MAG: DNA primase, partial [Deltaproteobacteria bacterium]|nr:DNA primase [Deltaproteobacteria bacterium]
LLLLAIFIPEDKILDIKNAADIVAVISEVVNLKKTGRNFVGLCPFHSEKTPSFSVSPEKQIFYCFGCGTGGNVFSFLMKKDGLAFPEAARLLARRYNIDIPRKHLTPEQKKRMGERESLLKINGQAMAYYHKMLLRSPSGKSALAYLKKRGLSVEIIERFTLGYAPSGWDNIISFFSKSAVPLAKVERSGLILPKKDRRGYYDRFRDRVVFPIIDVSQNVIGFGGRVMDDSLPKYLNSPETPVYSKSRSLYGLYLAKDKGRTTDCIYIVEGYLDLLALHQYGIENAVATLGTALTVDHVRMLSRYVPRLILVYDSDEAGIRSARRCVDTFWQEHVDFSRGDVFREENADTQILVLPDGHDPDTYLRKEGVASFQKAAAQAPGIMSFLIEQSIAKHGLSTEGKIRVVADLKSPLATINDNVARSLYVKQLAERIGIEENIILQEIRAGTASKEIKYSGKTADFAQSEGSRLERQIIAMMLQFPAILPEIRKFDVIEYIENSRLHSIATTILESRIASEKQISELFIDKPDLDRLISSLAMVEESWEKDGCLKLIAQFVKNGQRRRDRQVLDQIRAAEKMNDQETLAKLLKKKQQLAMRSQKQKLA